MPSDRPTTRPAAGRRAGPAGPSGPSQVLLFGVFLLVAALAVAALVALPRLLDGGGEDAALPQVNVGSDQSQQPQGPSVVGLMQSADDQKVVLSFPDGTTREFLVRPGEEQRIGIGHLASHAGLTDIGFRLFYETEAGKDYIVGAFETAPPQ